MTQEKETQWHHMVTVEKLEGLERKINVIYDAIAVQMAHDKGCEIVRKQATVKGYRKGKAPKSLIENIYKEDVRNMAKAVLVQEGYMLACHEQKLSPVGKPEMISAHFHLDGTFACDLKVEVMPDINPVGYLGMTLKKPVLENFNEEEMVERNFESMKKGHTKKVDQEFIEDGSLVVSDFWVFKNGKQIDSGENNFFIVKEATPPPFGKNLIGVKVGEMVTEEIIIPEGHKEAGEKRELKLEIKDAHTNIAMTDEEILEKMKLSTMEEVKDRARESVKMMQQSKEREALEEAVVDKLVEMHEFEVPEKWVEGEEQQLYKQFNYDDPEKIDEEVKENMKIMALRNIKRSFITEAIFNAENLQISEEEMQQTIMAEAYKQHASPEEFKKQVEEQNLMEGIKGIVKQKKVMELILKNIQIEEETKETQNKEISIPENPLE